TSPTSARPPISAATASTSAAVRAVTATCIPAAASSRATFAPIPRPPPVTSATPSRRSSDGTCDLLQCFRVLERREVARVLPQDARANRAADDLRAPRLRQRADEEDPLRPEGLAQLVRDALADLARQRVVRLGARARHAEDPRHLALDLVRHAHRRRLGDRRVGDGGRLELGRADPLAGDVQRVVGAAVQEPVAVLVDRGPVAVRPDAGEAPPVRVEVALRVAPDPARHPGPGSPADELADLAA